MKKLALLCLTLGCAGRYDGATIGAPPLEAQRPPVYTSRVAKALEGVLPVNVQVLNADLNPVPGVLIRVFDDVWQVYESGPTDSSGATPMQLPVAALARWQLKIAGTPWRDIGRPQISELRESLRAVIILGGVSGGAASRYLEDAAEAARSGDFEKAQRLREAAARVAQ